MIYVSFKKRLTSLSAALLSSVVFCQTTQAGTISGTLSSDNNTLILDTTAVKDTDLTVSSDLKYTDSAIALDHFLTLDEITTLRSTGCFTHPSCTALGYTQEVGDCTTTLKCPYDTSYEVCIDVMECSDGLYTEEDCATRGGTQGDEPTKTLLDGTQCYTCPLTESCPTDSYTQEQCTGLGGTADTLVSTLSDGTKCYTCNIVETCPTNTYTADDCYSQNGIPSYVRATLSDGTECYGCTFCSNNTGYTALVKSDSNTNCIFTFGDGIKGITYQCCKVSCDSGYTLIPAGTASPDNYGCKAHDYTGYNGTAISVNRCCKECASGTYATFAECKENMPNSLTYTCETSGVCYKPVSTEITFVYPPVNHFSGSSQVDHYCAGGGTKSDCTTNMYAGYQVQITRPDNTVVTTSTESGNETQYFSSTKGKHNICLIGTSKSVYYQYSSADTSHLKREFDYIKVQWTGAESHNQYLCRSTSANSNCTGSQAVKPSSTNDNVICWNGLTFSDFASYNVILNFTGY